MALSENIEAVTGWAAANLPVVIGGAVAAVVLTAICILTRQRRLSEIERLARAAAASSAAGTGTTTKSEEKALQWDPPDHSYADRRGSMRREGSLVRVILAAPSFRNGFGEGIVLDRSTGGLRITVATPIEPGTSMQVRAANAPESIDPVGVLVRSCRKTGEFFEIGCEFEKTPPWNVLLLFG